MCVDVSNVYRRMIAGLPANKRDQILDSFYGHPTQCGSTSRRGGGPSDYAVRSTADTIRVTVRLQQTGRIFLSMIESAYQEKHSSSLEIYPTS